MARVISNLPNHSELVNGIKFIRDRGEMISEEISDEVAATLATIKGYRLAGKKGAKGKGAEGSDPTSDVAGDADNPPAPNGASASE